MARAGQSERVPDGVGIDAHMIGQTHDTTTGLMHYNARYYDPLLGRFISADTIIPNPADPQQLNRYSYVTNNPVSYNDPDGHVGRPVMDGGSCYGEYHGINAGSNNNCTWQRRRAEEVNSMTDEGYSISLPWLNDVLEGVSDAPLSSGGRGGRCSGFFVFPHSAGDAVGEMAFVGSSGFAAGFALSGFPVDECLGVLTVALLGDAGDVEHAVDAPVSAEVETMFDWFTVSFSR